MEEQKYPKLMGIDIVSEIDWRSEYRKCKDPDVLAYRKEMADYEGFYVTENENLMKKSIGGVQPSDPDYVGRAADAANQAIEHYNKTTTEGIEFEEVVRSNIAMGSGFLRFITFRASNGKFYETKVWMEGRGVLGEFYFLREAKFYPNLTPSSSSEIVTTLT